MSKGNTKFLELLKKDMIKLQGLGLITNLFHVGRLTGQLELMMDLARDIPANNEHLYACLELQRQDILETMDYLSKK